MSGIERAPLLVTAVSPDSPAARFGNYHLDTEKFSALLSYEGVPEESIEATCVLIHDTPTSKARTELILSTSPIDRVIRVPVFSRIARVQATTKERLERATNHALLASTKMALDLEDIDLQKAEAKTQFRTFIGLAAVGAMTAAAVTEPTLATTLIGGVSSFVAGKGLASARRHVRTAKRAMRFANQKMSHPVWSSMIEIQERPARA